MSWVAYIVEDLVPQLGGFPTFVEDPDRLLQLPLVIDSLTAAGASIEYWDGTEESLATWETVPPSCRPIVICDLGAPRHLVEHRFQVFTFDAISIGEIFPKFFPEVVREIPVERWDAIMALHDRERRHGTAEETALLAARALYGVDPDYLNYGEGWSPTLKRIVDCEQTLPDHIARAVASKMHWDVDRDTAFQALTALPAAQSLLERLEPQEPRKPSDAGRATKEKQRGYGTEGRVVDPTVGHRIDGCSPQEILGVAIGYAKDAAAGRFTFSGRSQMADAFLAWCKANYAYALTSPSRSVLRLPTLVEYLHESIGDDKLLLLVIDSLGLEAWTAVESAWTHAGVMSRANTMAAFALLPTITSISRRSLFEGKLPTQFGSEDHSFDLEKKAWQDRFPGFGGCYRSSDVIKIDNALAKGQSRIAILESQWDEIGHNILPESDTIADAAGRWAKACALKSIVKDALVCGYRIFITADHGNVPCLGRGKPNVGVLAPDRSKRVLLFPSAAVRDAHRAAGEVYMPYALPPDMNPLFAEHLLSFDTSNSFAVSHGGISLEEAIVPVVEVFA